MDWRLIFGRVESYCLLWFVKKIENAMMDLITSLMITIIYGVSVFNTPQLCSDGSKRGSGRNTIVVPHKGLKLILRIRVYKFLKK